MLATARRSAGPCRALAERFSAAMVSVTASSSPSTSSTGLAPAVRHLKPSCTSTSARTVAVVVPSPATSLVCFETSRSTCAPIFSNGHSSSISLAMMTPSREMIGVPIGRSMIAFMPFGPSVPRTALASLATPLPSAAESAVKFGVDADAPEPRNVGSKAVGFQPRSLCVDESRLIGTQRPNDGAPFKIAPYQFLTFIVDRKPTKLHQCQGDDHFGRVPHPEEVVEQRYLPALVCLDQECLTQIIQVAIGLNTEGLL